MHTRRFHRGGRSCSQGHWDHACENIPDSFPSRSEFFKTVGIGIMITLAQFGILVVLVAKPWH
jgi:hypothetical protein